MIERQERVEAEVRAHGVVGPTSRFPPTSYYPWPRHGAKRREKRKSLHPGAAHALSASITFLPPDRGKDSDSRGDHPVYSHSR